MSIFDEPEHDPLSPIPDLDGLARDEAIEAIKEWFFQNFEDPAERTPYESAEGGYIYIWGGPYDTRDIIENVFADTASGELITAAIQEVEREGAEWVPSDRRHRDPQDEEPPDQPEPTQEELHALMQEGLKTIKEGLTRTPKPPAGMGHNRPPEPLEPEPLTPKDTAELVQAIETLQSQPVDPPDRGAAAEAAVLTFESKRERNSPSSCCNRARCSPRKR
jgi:HEPN/RES N-terminal domain 1